MVTYAQVHCTADVGGKKVWKNNIRQPREREEVRMEIISVPTNFYYQLHHELCLHYHLSLSLPILIYFYSSNSSPSLLFPFMNDTLSNYHHSCMKGDEC